MSKREPKDFKILVGCEESQAVTIAFRELGFEAYSCDLLPCSGGHPEWHLQMDLMIALHSKNWSLVVAHPTCTYLCNSGVCWLKGNPERFEKMLSAVQFFVNIKAYCEAKKIPYCIENPIPHKYAVNDFSGSKGIGKYSQIIQPYQFGHTESKATCLWLKGLPKLIPTNDVKEQWKLLPKNEAQRLHYLPPGPERAKLRSKTFQGIAKAMADQWGSFLINNNHE